MELCTNCFWCTPSNLCTLILPPLCSFNLFVTQTVRQCLQLCFLRRLTVSLFKSFVVSRPKGHLTGHKILGLKPPKMICFEDAKSSGRKRKCVSSFFFFLKASRLHGSLARVSRFLERRSCHGPHCLVGHTCLSQQLSTLNMAGAMEELDVNVFKFNAFTYKYSCVASGFSTGQHNTRSAERKNLRGSHSFIALSKSSLVSVDQ